MSLRDKVRTVIIGIRFAFKELCRLPADAKEHATHSLTEEQLTAQRLARRYDPSYALNESFERAREKVQAGVMAQAQLATPPSKDPAINQHYENMRRNPPQLTSNQTLALEVQRRTQLRNLGSKVER